MLVSLSSSAFAAPLPTIRDIVFDGPEENKSFQRALLASVSTIDLTNEFGPDASNGSP